MAQDAAKERMIDTVRRHEIQVLRRAGHSLAETAELVGVSAFEVTTQMAIYQTAINSPMAIIQSASNPIIGHAS
jgi:hypothetical protein